MSIRRAVAKITLGVPPTTQPAYEAWLAKIIHEAVDEEVASIRRWNAIAAQPEIHAELCMCVKCLGWGKPPSIDGDIPQSDVREVVPLPPTAGDAEYLSAKARIEE